MAYQVHPGLGDLPVGRLRATRRAGICAAAALLMMLLVAAMLASSAQAASPPLGTADTFAVLAGSTVTNTGPSVISGDLGLSPGTAVTGFPPGTVTGGTIHAADAVAAQAQSDLTTAYNVFAGQPSSATISADLAGRTLTSGVYTSSTSTPGLALSGDLTLDAQGDPNAVFVFQAKSTLIVGSGSHVNLINGAQPCNVYWQVGSSATIGAGTTFVGNILALTSISLTTGVTLNGSALARNGAVTLDTNLITKTRCSTPTRVRPVATPTSATSSGGPVSVVLHGSDSTGAPLTYAITSGPSHGTLGPIDQASDTATYTPTSGLQRTGQLHLQRLQHQRHLQHRDSNDHGHRGHSGRDPADSGRDTPGAGWHAAGSGWHAAGAGWHAAGAGWHAAGSPRNAATDANHGASTHPAPRLDLDEQ